MNTKTSLNFCFLILMACVVGCTSKTLQRIPTTVHTSIPSTPEVPTLAETAFISTLIPTAVAPTQIWNNDFLVAYIKDSIDPGFQDDNSLYLINSRGQNQINVFEGLSGIRGWDFSWSASGNWLLFSEYESKPKEGEIAPPFILWVVRSDGTQRRKLMTISSLRSVNWAKDKDIFLISCDVREGDTEICIIDPEKGNITRTGNIGTKAKFRSDSSQYAYIQNGTEIYVVNPESGIRVQVFSATGQIPDFSWVGENGSIVTAVVDRKGCGNKKDGFSRIVEVDIATKQVKTLREIEWSLDKVDLSPDGGYILGSWLLCVGNTYELDGVIGLNNDLVTWPLENFTEYQWSEDGKYLVASYTLFGNKYFVDPYTGTMIEIFEPPFLRKLLPADNSYAVYWAVQPMNR